MRGERAHRLEINALGGGRHPGEPHVFDHLHAQRCHHAILSSSDEAEISSRPSKSYPGSAHPATVPQPATAKPFSPTSFMLRTRARSSTMPAAQQPFLW